MIDSSASAIALFGATPAGRALAAIHWERSSLGSIDRWSTSLRATVRLVMHHRFPMLLGCGSEMLAIYNDAWLSVLAGEHPEMDRAPAARSIDAWPPIGMLMRSVWASGDGIEAKDVQLPLQGHRGLQDAPFTICCSPAFGDSDEVIGVLATVHELPRQRRASLPWNVQRDQMFDELRTPLTLLLAPLDEAMSIGALRGDDLTGAHRNARRLLHLVNGLPDIARVHDGEQQPRFVRAQVDRITRDVAAGFSSAFERAGLIFDIDCDPIEGDVWLDTEMYARIVSTLLANALNFTPSGSVFVHLRDHVDAIQLEVLDTGIGIAAADLPRVFERFHRIDSGWARVREGSGIGLSVLRDLVELHDGHVDVQSRPGKGSTFTVTLPKGRSAAAGSNLAEEADPSSFEDAAGWTQPAPLSPAAVPSSVGSSAARLLIADENADMRDYLARLLGQRWRVQCVADSAHALELIRRQPPDLLMCDVMMRGIDGFALLARLRADDATRTLPVILLSAHAGEEARLESLAHGADDYVTKPFSPRELMARVETQLIRSRLAAMDGEFTRRLINVFCDAPVGIALLRGRDHLFEFVNDDYAKLMGRRRLTGLTMRQALPELAGQGVFEMLDGVFETGRPVTGRSVRVMIEETPGATPSEHFFDFVYQPMRDHESMPVTGIAIVVYNVTALTLARREADAANRAKDEFLAILGHELRNPLAPIQTTLELMRLRRPGVFDAERAVIERQVQHLVRLVDDMLDVSRIVRGVIELKRETFDLREALARGIELAEPLMAQQRHALSIQLGPDPLWVHADPARLAQVVANLLNNAAKYTPAQGHVAIGASRSGAHIELKVRDNGVGITAAMLPRVFDMFTQEAQSLERSKGGLGLGLTIVRSLVELHGGQVQVESAGRGTGATFTVTLPANAPLEVDAPQPAAFKASVAGAQALRVLVVDDNVDAADSLAELLEATGHIAAIAHDSAQALKLAKAFAPDVALLDIGLPVMDGYELARCMREAGICSRLYALTGYGGAADRQKSKDAGFDGHFVKPVNFELLVEQLRGAAAS